MKTTMRKKVMDAKPVNKDLISEEIPEIGLIAVNGPNDPKPSIRIENGVIKEIDGVEEADFDFIDMFIAKYGIDVQTAEEAMAMDSLTFAKMLVDINVPREEIMRLANGMTPAKLVDVLNKLNIVEIMMAQMKMRARKQPANQAHVNNVKDNPVLMAADAAEAALRGFAEEETTCLVARMAPFNAMALLIGSQTGRPGVITQCALEEATELKLGMKGLTSYAETLSVYGTEAVMCDGDDTPWSKAFLSAAYASRGMKMRFSSGTGSEVMMGGADQKSMLYLEARCVWLTKACGSQGVQNGSIDGTPLSTAMPSGVRIIACECLMASVLGLECASGNDTYFSNSETRSFSKFMIQLLPGTDFINSGYSAVPNIDNSFTGSILDCDNYADVYMAQRDFMVDGGIHPASEEEVVAVRRKAASALQAVFAAFDFPEVTDEEVEAAVYAYTSKDMPDRNIGEDIIACDNIMDSDFNGFDIVKALHDNGFEDVADSILKLLKQRIAGDYLQTSAIFDEKFNVVSAINNKNDYQGPGTGYKISKERWKKMQVNMEVLKPDAYIEKSGIAEGLHIQELGEALHGMDSNEVVIALSPTFAAEQTKNMTGISHHDIIQELAAGIEEEGMKVRFVKVYNSCDLAKIASQGSKLSGSGIAVGLQAKGTAVIHQKDLVPLDNLELFSLSPLYTADTYRAIGKNAAKYAKGENPKPLPAMCDMSARPYMLKTTILQNQEAMAVVADRAAEELEIIID